MKQSFVWRERPSCELVILLSVKLWKLGAKKIRESHVILGWDYSFGFWCIASCPTHHLGQSTSRHFTTNQKKPDTTPLMYCLQRAGKAEGTASAGCLFSEMPRGPQARNQDKKNLPTAFPVGLISRAGQDKGGGFPLTANPAAVLDRRMSEEDPGHPVPGGAPAVTRGCSCNPQPLLYWHRGMSRASDHKFHFCLQHFSS